MDWASSPSPPSSGGSILSTTPTNSCPTTPVKPMYLKAKEVINVCAGATVTGTRQSIYVSQLETKSSCSRGITTPPLANPHVWYAAFPPNNRKIVIISCSLHPRKAVPLSLAMLGMGRQWVSAFPNLHFLCFVGLESHLRGPPSLVSCLQ